MVNLSANLGFLWKELDLVDAIYAAKKASFDAVECHCPYHVTIEDIANALKHTGLPMLSLNTASGNLEAGDNGLCALVGRNEEARAAIDQAIKYAVALNIPNIHVMAGNTSGKDAHNTFVENLKYACERVVNHDITILIEPLNKYNAPEYFLKTSSQAYEIIKEVGKNNLKLMFDCYHIQIMEGDISRRIETLMPIIGHVQIASVPRRNEPNQGELNYSHVIKTLIKCGYKGAIGAEYTPTTNTDDGLAWMSELRM